jgi:lysophospholipase L1-like esterase
MFVLAFSAMITSCGDDKKKKTAGDDSSATAAFSIYSIGDSTMCEYDNAKYTLGTSTERRGWGMMFSQFISNSNVTFVNKAISGRSSRDFYNDTTYNYWNWILNNLKSGDYVFIQFAHNDECYGGLSTEEAAAAGIDTSKTENSGTYGRGNEAYGTYQEYLGKYIDEARAKGANPVLIAPIVRLGSTPLSNTNCHNLTGNGTVPGSYTTYTSADYVSAMKEVATKKSCPFIDMTAATKTLVETYGQTAAKTFVYNDADDTHLKEFGAKLYAQLAAKLLVSNGVIAGALNPSALNVSISSYDYGSVYINETSDKAVSLYSSSMPSDSGTVAVTAPDQFSVSTSSSGPFTSGISLSYSGGVLSPTTIYVRFNPSVSGACSGSMTLTPSSGTARTIALSGTCITISSAKAIKTFSITASGFNCVGIVDETNKKVSVLLPSGTDRSALIADFTLSDRASATVGGVAQVSGSSSVNFTSDVVYTITAEDLSKEYYTVSAAPIVAGTSGITWLFSDSGWPASVEADGLYNGITSYGCSSVTCGASSRSGTLAGTSYSFTNRWQMPKNGSTASGYLAIPVVGPCTVHVAALSSTSDATKVRTMEISDKTNTSSYSLDVNKTGVSPADCSFSYTSSSPGTVYVYCTSPSAAASLYGIAVRY